MRDNFRPGLRLLLLLGALGLILALRGDRAGEWVADFASRIGLAPARPAAVSADDDVVRRTRRLPAPQRLDQLLSLLLRGQPGAAAELEDWRRQLRPGSLGPLQRAQLERTARRTFHAATRRALAGLVLADAGRTTPPTTAARPGQAGVSSLPDAWSLGLWGLRGEAPPDTLERLVAAAAPGRPDELRSTAWRALAAQGAAALPTLLGALRDPQLGASGTALGEGLLDLASTDTATRARSVPAALATLEATTLPPANRQAALILLRGVAGGDLGDDAAAWRGWWQTQQQEQRGQPAPR